MDLNTRLDETCVITKTWKTTPEGGDPKIDAVKVNGEIDFADMTLNDVLQLASKDVIISRQRIERKLSEIPAEITVSAKAPGVMPKDAKSIVSSMDTDTARETLALLLRKFEQ